MLTYRLLMLEVCFDLCGKQISKIISSKQSSELNGHATIIPFDEAAMLA